MREETDRPLRRASGFSLPRWLIITAGALLILIVAGTVTLKIVLSPDKLRAMVVPQIERRVGREVELASVRLKVFPRIAVRLDQLSIANPPGFSDGPMLDLEALELDLRFWPLLRKEFELGQVRLMRPVIRYHVLEDGTNNFQGLGSADELQASAIRARPVSFAAAGSFLLQEPTASTFTGAFFVSDLRVIDGTLLYNDRRNGRSASMALQVQASVERAATDGKAMESRGIVDLGSIKLLSPDLGQDSVALPDTRIEYELFADLLGDSVIIQDLRLAVGDLPLTGAGSIRRLLNERQLELSIEAADVDLASLISSLPDTIKTRLGDIDASGTAQLSLAISSSAASHGGAEIDGTLMLSDIDATHLEYGEILSAGSGELRFDETSISLPGFDGELLGRPFQLQLAISDFEDMMAEGQIAGTVNLARLAAMQGIEVPVEGVAEFDISFAGPANQPRALRLTGPIQLSDVSYQGASLAVPMVIRSATIRLTGDGIVSESIPVQLGTSDVTLAVNAPGSLPYVLSGGEVGSLPTLEFTLTSTKLDISELSIESEEVGYGDLVSARLAGKQIDGRDPVELAGEMLLPPIPPLNSRGLVQIDAFINPPNRVNNLSFQVRVQNGVLTVSNLSGRTYGGRLSGNLGLDFSDGVPPFPLTYDLSLEDANAGGFLRRWTRLGAPISGRVDLTINGSVAIDGTMLPSVDGVQAVGDLAFREGRFEQFALTDALARQLRIDFSKLADFRDFGGPFEVKDGNFVVQDWQIVSGDYTGTIGGAAGLGGSLDLGLELEVPIATLQEAGLARGTALAGLLSQLAGSGESLDVSVSIGGTMSNPVLQLDQQALQAQLGQLLQGQAGDLLNRLLQPRRDTSQVNR